MSVSQLEQMAPALRKAVVDSMGPMEDADLDMHIAAGTDEELRKGWLEGPFRESELSDILGDSWLCSKRFAVRQGEKVRLINDFSISRVNAATLASEKIALQGTDSFVAGCRHWHRLFP
eukprot:6342366-Amphidinium_carterae.1